MFSWSSGRRRSRNRWRSRSSSAARFSLRARATGMAGGVAGPTTVSAVARSSTSPVDSSEFFIASGRATTSPSTRTTVSASKRRRRRADVSRTVLRVERHLHDPRAIAKVDERQSAEVAIAVHPAAEAHTLAYVRRRGALHTGACAGSLRDVCRSSKSESSGQPPHRRRAARSSALEAGLSSRRGVDARRRCRGPGLVVRIVPGEKQILLRRVVHSSPRNVPGAAPRR